MDPDYLASAEISNSPYPLAAMENPFFLTALASGLCSSQLQTLNSGGGQYFCQIPYRFLWPPVPLSWQQTNGRVITLNPQLLWHGQTMAAHVFYALWRQYVIILPAPLSPSIHEYSYDLILDIHGGESI